MKSCRILYVVGQLGPRGGTERQLCFLLEGMDREYYRPQIAVWNYHYDKVYVPWLQRLSIPIHPMPLRAPGIVKLKAFRRLVKQLEPEVVHSYSFFTNFAAFWGGLGTKSLALGSARSDFLWEKSVSGPFLGRLSARWPRSQIYNSLAAAENARCCKSYFVPQRISVVRNAVDLQRYRMAPIPEAKRTCILGLGSLVAVKRWDRLLRGALALKRRGFELLVRIVGDGPLLPYLRTQSRILGVDDSVEFIGHSDRVPELLADAAFLAHTADSEGCPNAIAEAMACGRAVVATDAGDVPSLVEDGRTGFVIGRLDDDMLVERMATLITDRGLCRRMGEAARVKAEGEFGLERLVSQTLDFYRTAGWVSSS